MAVRVEGLAAADEALLLRGLREGAEAAYEELVRLYGPRMLAVARRFLPEDADARDALQDAFVNVCRSISGFSGDSRLSTWLHRVVVNAALMKLRGRRRRPEVRLEDLPSGTRESATAGVGGEWPMSAAEAMSHGEVRAQVRASIARLPEAFRVVLLLRDIEGVEIRTISDLLEISASTVKMRLHRGRQALRVMLDPFMRRDKP